MATFFTRQDDYVGNQSTTLSADLNPAFAPTHPTSDTKDFWLRFGQFFLVFAIVFSLFLAGRYAWQTYDQTNVAITPAPISAPVAPEVAPAVAQSPQAQAPVEKTEPAASLTATGTNDEFPIVAIVIAGLAVIVAVTGHQLLRTARHRRAQSAKKYIL